MRNAGNGKLPWFKFFATDWISDPYVRLMTSRQRGWYIDLLCWAWQEGGFLPDQAEIICQVLRDRQHIDYLASTSDSSTEEHRAIGAEFEAVLSHFTYVLADGRVSHNKLEPQRNEAKSLEKKHRKGANLTNTKRHNNQARSENSVRSAPVTADAQHDDSASQSGGRRENTDIEQESNREHLSKVEAERDSEQRARVNQNDAASPLPPPPPANGLIRSLAPMMAELVAIYELGGVPIPLQQQKRALEFIATLPQDQSDRITERLPNYCKWAFVSGRWNNPRMTKSLLHVLRDGDWDVEIIPRKLPESEDLSPRQRSVREAELRYLRSKGVSV